MEWQRDVAEVLADLQARTLGVDFRPRVEDVGRVQRIGDGVAFIEGLGGAIVDEIVVFANGEQGQVFDLDRDIAACVLYGAAEGIAAGSPVFRTGRTPAMPVGDALLGRVVDALGRPLDGLGPLLATESREMEQEAPGPLDRQPIRQALFTGIKAIDAAIPIGLGQRELILGDRETGKSGLAIDAIINQRDSGVVCIYVSVGHKRASVVELVEEFRQYGALSHSVVIVADAGDPVSLVYLAPYAGCALAEWFAYRGGHALIVYDDLSRHAEAYRSLSLILRRPPGREAYPGDVFSAHARLMERAFKLSESRGGGSVTALPIIETQQGDIASFISTNLISMTDGQLYLDTALFTQAQLPAIDIGRSVSRVGRDAQPGAMRDAAANLRLEIAQYEEVKGFARFGAILDEATRAQIARGERLTRVLGQRERQVVPLAVQVAELWALKSGLLDDLTPGAVPEFERQLVELAAEFAHVDPQVVAAPSIGPDLARDLRRWAEAAKDRLGGPGG
ncbi:MAG TPA: F0F1 ATP synthase subunit alpha [bacterium]|nr:F0F1 ATP synthase subunit alpha [bacterium]